MSYYKLKAHSRDCQTGQCPECTWTRCTHRCHTGLRISPNDVAHLIPPTGPCATCGRGRHEDWPHACTTLPAGHPHFTPHRQRMDLGT